MRYNWGSKYGWQLSFFTFKKGSLEFNNNPDSTENCVTSILKTINFEWKIGGVKDAT